MENKINIAELLKDCPQGMELDCTMVDDVTFYGIGNEETIVVKRELVNLKLYLDRYGAPVVFPKEDLKCVIFPKGKTSWEGFVPPCKFKDGDVIFTHADCLKVGLGNTWISIYQENRNGGVATYVDYAEDGSDYYSDIDGDKTLLCMEKDILRQRLATEEEKQKLFQAIKEHGYKWDEDTKKLVPNKFDITTLKPFDKVLTRDNDSQKWDAELFSFYNNESEDYHFQLVGVCSARYCIPYEENKHLLGTTNDCDDFYKTWE